MVLNNYKRLAIAKQFLGSSSSGESKILLKNSDGDGIGIIKDINGYEPEYLCNQSASYYPNVGATYGGVKKQTYIPSNTAFDLIVGNGNTPATVDDFKLENDLYDNIAYVSQSITRKDNVLTITKKMKNNTGDSITIKEVGLKSAFYHGDGSITPVLLTRDVLSSPLTVPDQKIFIVVATITLKI